MIVKHVPMKAAKKSDFAVLVKYIIDPQSKHERVGAVNVSNCHSEHAEIAMLEVLNTQTQNTRSTADKTYHLIVSFRPGESPDEEVLKAIEERICAGLGFTGHQRVSAVHHDTDNLHMHIVVNKIHPRRYTIHEPFNAYHTLGQLGAKLEQEYGLEKDNHKAIKIGSENRASDMERHTNVESLLGWIKRECTDQIQATQSWVEMHDVMQSHGLTIHERANGLVISAEDGTSVKASSVNRQFSKAKLEERLGSFKAASPKPVSEKPAKRYTKQPLHSGSDTVELYAHYKSATQLAVTSRTAEWDRARARKNRLIEAAKRTGRLKRAAIKLLRSPGVAKKLMYAMTSKALREEIASINQQYFKERQEIYEKYRQLAWADWLRHEATSGDKEALAALRAHSTATGLKGNTLRGTGDKKWASAATTFDSITKEGTIIYRVGDTAVRDDGDRLKVSRGADRAGLEAALRMAMERYGTCIAVNGSAAFKEQIVRVAAAANLSVNFDDKALERRRKQLNQSSTKKEKKHGNANTGNNFKRRSTGIRNGRGGAAAAKRAAAGRADTAGVTKHGSGNANRNQPHPGGARSKTPPQARDGLRGLSELGVVHVPSGAKVLLPGHVSGHVEHQGAKPDHRVRRNVRGTGRLEPDAPGQTSGKVFKPNVGRVGTAPPPASKDRLRRISQVGEITIGQRPQLAKATPAQERLKAGIPTPSPVKTERAASKPASVRLLEASPAAKAADKYVIEREQKRCNGFDIPKHARYTFIQEMSAEYAGTRRIDEQALALLKVGKEILVLPVDEATARRLKRISLGQQIEVSAKGVIKTKGRSR